MKHEGDTEKVGETEPALAMLMAAYDWKYAMRYAKFDFIDIDKVLVVVEGVNDGANWKLVVKLKDGKFGWLSAGCDCSGWDCQSGGESAAESTFMEAVKAVMAQIHSWNEDESVEFQAECMKVKI